MTDADKPDGDCPPAGSPPEPLTITVIVRFRVAVPGGGEVELRVCSESDRLFLGKLCRESPMPREFAIRLLVHETLAPDSVDYAAWDDAALLSAARAWWDHGPFPREERTQPDSLESFRDVVCRWDANEREKIDRLFRSHQTAFTRHAAEVERLRRPCQGADSFGLAVGMRAIADHAEHLAKAQGEQTERLLRSLRPAFPGYVDTAEQLERLRGADPGPAGGGNGGWHG